MDNTKSFMFKWNNIDKVYQFNFHSYFQRGLFTDCTLVTEKKFINCHKIILSACSPYFEEIFEFNENSKYPTQQQLVAINEISHDILQLVLEFAYKGEVSIDKDCYERFFQAAQILKLKGVANANCPSLAKIDPADNPPNPKQPSEASLSPPLTPNNEDVLEGQDELNMISENFEFSIKTEPTTPLEDHEDTKVEVSEPPKKAKRGRKRKSNNDDPKTPEQTEEEKAAKRIKSRTSLAMSPSPCKFCDKLYAKNSLYFHLKVCQLNPDRITFSCANCQKELSRPDKLAHHMKICSHKPRASM